MNSTRVIKWVPLVFAVGLLTSFFLPWVAWSDSAIGGYYLPAGKFFSVAESKFGMGNPIPQLNFTFYAFWLIPALCVLLIALHWLNKKNNWPAYIAGALSLSLLTIYFLFSRKLIDLGAGTNVFNMLKVPVYIQAICAVGLIVTAFPVKNNFVPVIILLAGPVIAFAGYKMVEKKVMTETFTETDRIKADYTVNALDLIREFAANDSAANQKYREKILVINGNISAIERLSDSSINIRFADTTGSYIIFSFDKQQYNNVKDIKSGDPVSVKGACSGSIFSQILGTTSISFKRSTLNKKNTQ